MEGIKRLSLFLIVRFFKDLFLGFRSAYRAGKFIIEHKLYWFMLIPAALMLLIYYIGSLILQHSVKIQADNMNEIIWYLIYLMLEISIAVLLMKFSKYLVIAILSPLISEISMKTEKILVGRTYPFSWRQLYHDIRRALRIIVRNMMWEYTFFLIIFLVSYLGWKDPVSSSIFYITFAIGFYYYGFGFMDYILERLRLDMDQSISFVRKHRGLAVAIGTIYSVLILVPVDIGALFDWSSFSADPINFLSRFFLHLLLWAMASAAPILAIVTATLAMHDLVDLSSNKHSQKIVEAV